MIAGDQLAAGLLLFQGVENSCFQSDDLCHGF